MYVFANFLGKQMHLNEGWVSGCLSMEFDVGNFLIKSNYFGLFMGHRLVLIYTQFLNR